MQTGLFQATVVVQGHTANVRVSEAEEEEEEEEEDEEEDDGREDVDRQFGFSSDTDEAVLGCQALAQLGLLVDCRRRRLIHSSEVRQGHTVSFCPGGTHVPLVFSSPEDSKRRAEVHALVDTGCTDVDLDPKKIEMLGLRVDPNEIVAQFETAGGVT